MDNDEAGGRVAKAAIAAVTPQPAELFAAASGVRRDEHGRFLTGSAGPGRKRGSRAKLAEAVMADVLASWERDGGPVLRRLAFQDPAKYAQFIAAVLPREIKVEQTSQVSGISDERFEDLLAVVQDMIAAKRAQLVTIEAAPLEGEGDAEHG